MSKQALGIAVNGRQVRIAHLVRDNKSIAVSFLESTTLLADLENPAATPLTRDQRSGSEEAEELFGFEQQNRHTETGFNSPSVQENANVLFALMKKFTARRIPIAFNIPAGMVSYQELNTTLDYDKNVFKGNLLKKIGQWKSGFNSLENVQVLERSDGTLINVALNLPQTPTLLSVLEQINSFVSGNLIFSAMTPNEVALCNLARKSYQFNDNKEINIIIQIESEFSRIIFMRGRDLLSVAPIITEPASGEIDRIICSKIHFELDNQNITQVANILLASQATNNDSKEFFEDQFPQSRVGFIVSQPLAEYIANQFSREDLSEYAVPLSLAWEVLAPSRDASFTDINLLPHTIIDRQRSLKLSAVGYILLLLLGVGAFGFTWQILAKRLEISQLKRQNSHFEEQIRNNQETVDRVHKLEREINNLGQSLALSDSLGKGFDDILSFLDKANASVQKTESVWIEKIDKNPTGFTLFGNAMQRKNIPIFSNTVGESIVRKVTRQDIDGRPVYSFEMQVFWPRASFPDFFQPKEPQTVLVNAGENANPTRPIDSSEALVQAEKQAGQDSLERQNTESAELQIPYAFLAALANFNAESSRSQEKPALLSSNTASISAGSIDSSSAQEPYTIRLAAFPDSQSAEAQSRVYSDRGYEILTARSADDSSALPIWV
ncbi:hypothetical protein JW992_01415, partial [candidate division KSB1 bacterium]|nr:hypothetical protein [candidate division KSB1 bacterium]